MEYTDPLRAEHGPGMCGCDREVFERVWRRVMPTDTYGSPVQLIGEERPAPPARRSDAAGDAPDPWRPESPMLPPMRPDLPTALPSFPHMTPPMTLPMHPPMTSPPLPSLPSAPPVCLGPGSAVHGAQLQEFIARELADCRCYMALARRCRGGGAQTLSTIASDEKRHARRLSAAYFLISGVRYWPVARPGPAPNGPLPACLRQAFLNEQMGETAYRVAAARASDPCLRELYLDLAEDEAAHAALLRGLLEQM